MAGQGAIIIQRDVTTVAYAFAPIELGTDALVIGSPTSPRPPWCDTPVDQVIYTDVTRILVPSGAMKANDHGQFFTWVYFGVRDKDIPGKLGSDKWWNSLCTFMDTHTPGAVGLTSWHYVDSDLVSGGPGIDTWGGGIAGTLQDTSGRCSSGLIEFVTHYRAYLIPGSDYPACWPGCMALRNDIGPLLACVD